MSASPGELPAPLDEADVEAGDQPPRTPITPHEFDTYELKALGLLRTHADIRRDTDWVSRLTEHIEHNGSPPRPRDLVRALERAPDRVMIRSVGTAGVSDYRYDTESGMVVQRSHSDLFEHDGAPDDGPIRTKRIPTREATDLVRGTHLIPIDHWGTDLESEFDRFEDWQEPQR